MEAFSMFDSVGDALDELRSLRKEKNESIDEHIARFKMLAAESKIDMTNPLSIKLFKETLPWGLTLELIRSHSRPSTTGMNGQQRLTTNFTR
jgi:hypothetical protein